MAFTEDLAAFYGPDDPGVVAATFGAATVYGEFRDAYANPFGGEDVGVGVESSAPHFWCAFADVSTAAHGSTLVINGSTYAVCGIEPDGTGIVMLRLEKQ